MLMSIIMVITIYYYINNPSEIGNEQTDLSMYVCLT